MELEELLTRSAPVVTPRDGDLTRDLDEMVALSESEVSGHGRRSTRPLAAAAVAVTAVLGLGGVAAANDILPGWFPWTTTEGSSCELQASVELRTDRDGSLITSRASASEQRASKAAADDYVSSLDLSTIDRQQAADHWFDYLERVSVDHPSRAELEAKFQGDALETHALIHEIDTELNDYLTARGYDPRSLMTTIATGCDR